MTKSCWRTFSKKRNCKKRIKTFRIEKIIKKKEGKSYVKWKGDNNSFNSWIDEKGIV